MRIVANFLTCGSTGHSLVLRGRRLPRLVHINVVHRWTLHRTCRAESTWVTGWRTGLVHHPSRHIGRQRLHLCKNIRPRSRVISHRQETLIHIQQHNRSCRWFSFNIRCEWASVPGHREERKQAFGLSSGSCASAAPDASASPSPAPAGAEWPAAFAFPDTPRVKTQTAVSRAFLHSWLTRGGSLLHHLLLLPHDLQFLCKLNLPLPLRLLRCTTQLLSVFISKSVESSPSVTHLS